MYMAIAVETSKHPTTRGEYKIWYLELSEAGDVISIGVKPKKEVIASIFEHYRKTGKTNWRAFLKDEERSIPVEIFDFIAQNMNENTHFGNLPSLAEFQETLSCLKLNLEMRSIA